MIFYRKMSAQETLLTSTGTYAVLDVKISVDEIENTSKCTRHQVSLPDLRRELLDVVQCVDRVSSARPEAECRERLEGFDVAMSGCSGGGAG